MTTLEDVGRAKLAEREARDAYSAAWNHYLETRTVEAYETFSRLRMVWDDTLMELERVTREAMQ